MNEKMTRVLCIGPQEGQEGQPVSLDAVKLYKDSNEAIYAELLWTSHAEKTIIAIIAQLIGSDITGKQIDTVEHQYLDLLLFNGSSVGEGKMIALNDKRVRKLKIAIDTVVYEDGSMWVCGEQERADNEKDKTEETDKQAEDAAYVERLEKAIENTNAQQTNNTDRYDNKTNAEDTNKQTESEAGANKSKENPAAASNRGNKTADGKSATGKIKLPLIIVSVVLLALALTLGGIWLNSQKADSVKVGDIITFGRYPQTGGGTDRTPIEWKILDVNGQKALVISRYALDCKPYDMQENNAVWDTCLLRSWLNVEFLNSAFSPEEQAAIETAVANNGALQDNRSWIINGGFNTQDKVFLLDTQEADRYFTDQEARRCAPTDYAVKNAAWINEAYQADGRPACCWWLRSPGEIEASAQLVDDAGGLGRCGLVNNLNIAVRPALWVNLSSGVL